MRVIISPAKKMRVDRDSLHHNQLPHFIDDAEILLRELEKKDYKDLKKLWQCNDAIASLNYERLQNMDLYGPLTPAILAYEGIQYQRMAAGVMQSDEYDYLEAHVRIVSGFYGLLRPFDGVVPYRLEMKAKLANESFHSLYDFWHSKLADKLYAETQCIINLASKEYSQCFQKFLRPEIAFITCIFGEVIENKIVEKGTLVKMARGEMVKYMAEKKIKVPEDLKLFNRSNYSYREDLSDKNTFVFIKQ